MAISNGVIGLFVEGKKVVAERQASIADVTVSGTYATDDDAIETAINAIIAALVAHGLIEEAE